jgi:hypothetical protein
MHIGGSPGQLCVDHARVQRIRTDAWHAPRQLIREQYICKFALPAKRENKRALRNTDFKDAQRSHP